jgi:hypothetical protein
MRMTSIEEVTDSTDDDGEEEEEEDAPSRILISDRRTTLWNFRLMSILFSANHGCAVGKKKKQKGNTN